MQTYKNGNVEVRFFAGNDRVFVMYKDHKFFVDTKDIDDFIRSLMIVAKENTECVDCGTKTCVLLDNLCAECWSHEWDSKNYRFV